MLCRLNINILFAGTQVFTKARGKSGNCKVNKIIIKYRLNHMGTVLFESLIKNQKIKCDIELILTILKEKQIKFVSLKEGR